MTVEIAKADLKGSFAYEEFHFPLTQGSSYNSATENPLTISEAENPNYTADPGTYTYQSSDSAVASADNAGSIILVRGQAGESAVITVTVPGDGNYNSGTFQYTLHISDDLEQIEYTVNGYRSPTYNGQAHTLTVEVTDPASAQVLYMDAGGDYTLTAPPAYTDVKRNADTGDVEGYEIKFQITAPGYTTVEGSATLTIQPKPITKGMFEDSIGSYTYTGKQIVPDPVVKDGTLLLVKGKDYTVTWGEPNQYVGVYDETAKTAAPSPSPAWATTAARISTPSRSPPWARTASPPP